MFESVIRFDRKLLGAKPVNPAAPLPPLFPSPLEPAAPVPPVVDAAALAEKEREEARLRQERKAIEGVLRNLGEAARELRSKQQEHLAEMQRLGIELGVAIAGRLVHQRLEAGDFSPEGLVQELVGQLEVTDPVTVHLHPADYELLKKRLGDSPVRFADKEVRLAVDGSLERGACRAESAELSVLSRLDERLAEIRQRLLSSLGEEEIRPYN